LAAEGRPDRRGLAVAFLEIGFVHVQIADTAIPALVLLTGTESALRLVLLGLLSLALILLNILTIAIHATLTLLTAALLGLLLLRGLVLLAVFHVCHDRPPGSVGRDFPPITIQSRRRPDTQITVNIFDSKGRFENDKKFGGVVYTS